MVAKCSKSWTAQLQCQLCIYSMNLGILINEWRFQKLHRPLFIKNITSLEVSVYIWVVIKIKRKRIVFENLFHHYLHCSLRTIIFWMHVLPSNLNDIKHLIHTWVLKKLSFTNVISIKLVNLFPNQSYFFTFLTCKLLCSIFNLLKHDLELVLLKYTCDKKKNSTRFRFALWQNAWKKRK